MSTNKSEHYQLNLWEPEDDFLRTEFNENFSKLDTATAGKIGAVFGTYTGNGARERKIDLGFTPSAVLLMTSQSKMEDGNSLYGGLALPGNPVLSSRDHLPVLSIVEGGIMVYYEYSNYGTICTNSGTFHYIAFR